MYWLPEGCIKHWYDKPTGDGWLQEVWGGGAMKQCRCILYLDQALRHTATHRVKTQDLRHYDSHHRPYCPFTHHISLGFPYYFGGLWAFCQAVLLLTYIVATKMWSYFELFATKMRSYRELNPWYIIHIVGFITPVFLPVCVMIMVGLAIIQAWIWVRVFIGKCVIFIPIRHRVRQFEFQCKCTVMRRNFKNVILNVLYFLHLQFTLQ